MEVEFSRQISETLSNIKLHKNSSSGGRVVPCGRADEHKPNSCFSQFFKLAQKRQKSETRGTNKFALTTTLSSFNGSVYKNKRSILRSESASRKLCLAHGSQQQQPGPKPADKATAYLKYFNR